LIVFGEAGQGCLISESFDGGEANLFDTVVFCNVGQGRLVGEFIDSGKANIAAFGKTAPISVTSLSFGGFAFCDVSQGRLVGEFFDSGEANLFIFVVFRFFPLLCG